MADESLREFHLEGKQLVFLFMSATIVAIVIFLCGVLVGRGLRAPRAVETIAAGETGADPTGEHAAAPLAPSTPPPSADLPPDTPTEDELPGVDGLAHDSPSDNFTPGDSRRVPVDPTRPVPSPAPAAAPAPTSTARGTAAGAAPKATEPPVAADAPTQAAPAGFQVQVAATPRRSEADSIAARLKRKGYPVFVTTPPKGPRMYRVRVGPYTERRAADAVAAKLDKEEQFKPWVTR